MTKHFKSFISSGKNRLALLKLFLLIIVGITFANAVAQAYFIRYYGDDDGYGYGYDIDDGWADNDGFGTWGYGRGYGYGFDYGPNTNKTPYNYRVTGENLSQVREGYGYGYKINNSYNAGADRFEITPNKLSLLYQADIMVTPSGSSLDSTANVKFNEEVELKDLYSNTDSSISIFRGSYFACSDGQSHDFRTLAFYKPDLSGLDYDDKFGVSFRLAGCTDQNKYLYGGTAVIRFPATGVNMDYYNVYRKKQADSDWQQHSSCYANGSTCNLVVDGFYEYAVVYDEPRSIELEQCSLRNSIGTMDIYLYYNDEYRKFQNESMFINHGFQFGEIVSTDGGEITPRGADINSIEQGILNDCLDITSCRDSDGGKNYNDSGYVNVTHNIGYSTQLQLNDQCMNSSLLAEYYCANNMQAMEEYVCPSACYNGKCVSNDIVGGEQCDLINPAGTMDIYIYHNNKYRKFNSETVFLKNNFSFDEIETVNVANLSPMGSVIYDADEAVMADCSCPLTVKYGGGPWNSTGTIRNQGGYYRTTKVCDYGSDNCLCWFKDNLNIGTEIVVDVSTESWDDRHTDSQTDNNIIEKYCFTDRGYSGNYPKPTCEVLGGLYQASELANYNFNDSQGLCPVGWRIPTENEFSNNPDSDKDLIRSGIYYNLSVDGDEVLKEEPFIKAFNGYDGATQDGVNYNDHNGFFYGCYHYVPYDLSQFYTEDWPRCYSLGGIANGSLIRYNDMAVSARCVKDFNINTSSCGNGVIDSGEECDGSNLNSKTCTSFGYDRGALKCNSECRYDKSACSNIVVSKQRCSGALPSDALWWSDGYWYSQGSKSTHHRASNSSSQDCDYHCKTGYEYENGKCLKSSDDECKWTKRDSLGSKDWRDIAISRDGNKIAAVAKDNYVHISLNGGKTWVNKDMGSGIRLHSVSSSADGNKLVVGDWNGYIYTSVNGGNSWTKRISSGESPWKSISSSSDGNKLLATTWGLYVYSSTDSGETWIKRNNSVLGNNIWHDSYSSTSGNNLAVVGLGDYIYTSSNSGVDWIERTSAGEGEWESIAGSDSGTKLIAADSHGYLYTSTNSGKNWTKRTSAGSKWWSGVASSADGDKLFASVSGGYIYKSIDSGANWERIDKKEDSHSWRNVVSSADGNMLVASKLDYIYTYDCSSDLCGNGVLNSGEDCDGNNLDGKTCKSFGYNSGTLKCSNCSFDKSSCVSDVSLDGTVACNIPLNNYTYLSGFGSGDTLNSIMNNDNKLESLIDQVVDEFGDDEFDIPNTYKPLIGQCTWMEHWATEKCYVYSYIKKSKVSELHDPICGDPDSIKDDRDSLGSYSNNKTKARMKKAIQEGSCCSALVNGTIGGYGIGQKDSERIRAAKANSTTSVNNETSFSNKDIEKIEVDGEGLVLKLQRQISRLEQLVVDLEKRLITRIDRALTKRLGGRVILQAESNGEAWYVDPKSGSKFYMRDGQSAYEMLKAFGLGITNDNLAKIPVGYDSRLGDGLTDSDGDTLPDVLEEALGTDPYNKDTDNDGYDDNEELEGGYRPNDKGMYQIDQKLINRLGDGILLQVESKGEAWLVKEGKRYYINPVTAYNAMKYLSLGISNADIRMIEVGNIIE